MVIPNEGGLRLDHQLVLRLATLQLHLKQRLSRLRLLLHWSLHNLLCLFWGFALEECFWSRGLLGLGGLLRKETPEYFVVLEPSLVVECHVFFRRYKCALGLSLAIHKTEQLFTGRPEGRPKVGHIPTVLLLNRILADVRPHIVMRFLPRYLNLLQSVLRNELRDQTLPTPTDYRRHRQDVAREQPTAVCVARKGQDFHYHLRRKDSTLRKPKFASSRFMIRM